MNELLSILLLQDGMLFKSEKVYAVLAVILAIFIGFIVFLLLTGRKVSALEKELNSIKEDKTKNK